MALLALKRKGIEVAKPNSPPLIRGSKNSPPSIPCVWFSKKRGPYM